MEPQERTEAERAFHRAMIELYETAKRDLGHNAVRFLRMVSEHGGLKAAKLLSAPGVSEVSRLCGKNAGLICRLRRMRSGRSQGPIHA